MSEVVYCGCGGYDIFGAIPFLFRNQDANLVSLSFTPSSRIQKHAKSRQLFGKTSSAHKRPMAMLRH